MMAAGQKKIRIGEAAEAARTTPKALRQWLERYGHRGVKPSTEQTGTWFEFSFGDVAALALTRYFVEIGMSAYNAFATARGIIEARWPRLFDAEAPVWQPTPANGVFTMYFDPSDGWGILSLDPSVTRDTPPAVSRMEVRVMAAMIISDAFDVLEGMGHRQPTREVALPKRKGVE